MIAILRIPAVQRRVFERQPDPNVLIRIRDRLAAHADAPVLATRWCVCGNVHYGHFEQ